ncbi:hypothetical protein QWI17_02875 [Gilvimarinus sp. SDUM040013]|uniref:Surface antigen domain-containing protein n=1 Tax=Gilvimarinus gilvus TaxID=3058038 RepID=A0ABU4RZT2_9GAMM|nr:hypothetical protein [Gilvimarinus sp. SDUM040013]MDO3384777.1 hypothetical protein [Gilvimarinus sp. SDUM040013]MDX6850405.1 hypothetical protein [Gilvimarinus sp. SDUM040013]
MSNARVIGQVAIATSVSLLAGAIFYFGMSLSRIADNLPQTAASVTEITGAVTPIVDLIPAILQESEDIRLQTDVIVKQSQQIIDVLPGILQRVDNVVATVENVRADSTDILAESAAIRTEVAQVREEVELVRGDLPAILAELEAYRTELNGYRELAPQFLAESQAIRDTIDPTINRVEALVAHIDETASTAGESAVSGFFTGIIKAPFSLVSDITSVVTPSGKPLTEEQRNYLRSTLQGFIGTAEVGEKYAFQMPRSEFAGEVELRSESAKGGLACRQIRIVTYATDNRKKSTTNNFNVCRDKNGQWSVKQR